MKKYRTKSVTRTGRNEYSVSSGSKIPVGFCEIGIGLELKPV